MTEKEQRVEYQKLQLRIAETKVVDALSKLRLTKIKLQAEMERELSQLESDAQREKLHLETVKTYLTLAESELERGFDA
jgi:hypothetical protein